MNASSHRGRLRTVTEHVVGHSVWAMVWRVLVLLPVLGFATLVFFPNSGFSVFASLAPPLAWLLAFPVILGSLILVLTWPGRCFLLGDVVAGYGDRRR